MSERKIEPAASAPQTQMGQTRMGRLGKFLTGRRLRTFIILSVAVHLIAGLSWGIPAYVKSVRAQEQQRQAEMLRVAQKKAAEAALADAKTSNFRKTLAAVKRDTRKEFDALVQDLASEKKEKIWTTVDKKLDPAEQQLAHALEDRMASDQDLRNIKADLDRQLVSSVNETLALFAGQEEAEAFLNNFKRAVLPEVVAHYQGQIGTKIGTPLRTEADQFVNVTNGDSQKASKDLDAVRQQLGGQLDAMHAEMTVAQRESDLGQDPSIRGNADQIKAHLTQASVNLAAAVTAVTGADANLEKLAVASQHLIGGDDMASAVTKLRATVAEIKAGLQQAQTAADSNKPADLGGALTGVTLVDQRLVLEWTDAADSGTRVADAAAQDARGAVGAAKEGALPPEVQDAFAKAFHLKASDRIADLMQQSFIKRLKNKGITDANLAQSTREQLKTLLETTITAETSFGTAGTDPLVFVSGTADAAQNESGATLAKAFADIARKVIDAGAMDAASDTSDDAHLAELSAAQQQDLASDDVRDRVENIAQAVKDGRAGGGLDAINAGDLNDLRADALSRDLALDQPDADAATMPSDDTSELTEDVKKDVEDSLRKEFDKLMEGKLAKEKLDQVWKDVAAKSDKDVTKLAKDLLDPSVSDSALEQRRTAFSDTFLNTVRGALDQSAANDIAGELLKRLNGQLGDQVADAFKGAAQSAIGDALKQAFGKEGKSQSDKVSEQAKDLTHALAEAMATAGQAGTILNKAKDDVANAEKGGDPKAIADAVAAERGRVGQILKAFNSVKGDFDKAAANVPAGATQLKEQLATASKSFDDLSHQLADADKAGANGDDKAFLAALNTALASMGKFHDSAQASTASIHEQIDQAMAEFLKAVQNAEADAGKDPGIKSKITGQFNEKFRDQTESKLVDDVLRAYKENLQKGGVASGDADDAKLRSDITTALDKKVTGGQPMGDAAMNDIDHGGFLNDASKAKGTPSKELVDSAKHTADKVLEHGVGTAIDNTKADGPLAAGVGKLPGPDEAIGTLKDKIARMQGQLRSGRGGVLDDDATADAGSETGATGLSGIRRKWRKLLGGTGDGADMADADATGGASGGHAGGTGGATGTGTGATGAGGPMGTGGAAGAGGATGAGTGTGTGTGGGSGSGSGGAGVGMRVSSLRRAYRAFYDPAQYQKLMDSVKNRDLVALKGQTWVLKGAAGVASHADRDDAAVHPATILTPATKPSEQVTNDQPFKPTFQSIKFTSIPYLNHSLKIDGNFDAWKDIPALALVPERGDGKGLESLRLVNSMPFKMAWDNHGVYFMIDVTDADDKITKNLKANFAASDVAEVFLDTLNTKEHQRARGAGQQFWIWPFGSISDENVPGGESIKDRNSGFNFVEFKANEMHRFAKKTDHGYQLEFCLPVDHIRDADLYAGKILGINLTVETGTKVHYYWSASKAVATWARPDTWGDVLLAGSDGKLEVPERLADESGPGDPAKTMNGFVIGEPLRIRVTDRDMNLNDRVRDKVSVSVRNARGDNEVAILEETGPDTGVFEGSLRTALDIGEKIPGAISVFEGETVQITYMDQARANGARNTQVEYRVKAAPPLTNTVTIKQ